MYYWCKLEFSPDGSPQRFCIESYANELELIQGLAHLAQAHVWYYTDHDPVHRNEAGLVRLEKTQNLSGKDCERVVVRSTYDPITNEYHVETGYFLKDRQLVQVVRHDGVTEVKVVDMRRWHEQVMALMMNGVPRKKYTYKKSKWQGKTHRQGGHWHWQSNIRQNLRDISTHKVRAKRACRYKGAVCYDPKFHMTENNWKETKCRHQYEWHKKRHQDRMFLPEEDPSDYLGDGEMYSPEVWED